MRLTGRVAVQCPACEHLKSVVIETRPSHLRPEWTQRRRKCAQCGTRWNTVELPMSDVIGTEEVADE